MLSAEDVSKSIDGQLILSGVSLVAGPAQTTVIIGPNGSGKSTLLRIFSLVDLPDSGRIVIGEKAFVFPSGPLPNLQGVWPELTVVFQGLHLWPHMTLRENILLPARKRGIDEKSELLNQLVTAFDLGQVLDRYPNEASGGERQRVSIVRALALRPSMILLDEPTSSLDVRHVRVLVQQLKRCRDQGATILVVTHLLGFARQIADQVIFLDHGEVITTGPVEILESPKNRRLAEFIEIL